MATHGKESLESPPSGGAQANGHPAGMLTERPEVDPAASKLIQAEQAVRLRAVPYAFRNGQLLAAMLDPSDLEAADELSVSAGKPVQRVPISPDVFSDLLRGVYGTTAAQMAARLGGAADDGD